MGGRQIRPAKVYKTVTAELQNDILPGRSMSTPPWYNVMYSIPPSETIVRNVTPRHQLPNQKATKPKNIYRPQRIAYPEDALRKTFYKDHPWELARPRIIVESDGKDYQFCDWSKGLRQPGLPLSGESVVQRQLWLMQNQKMGKQQAYDITRREFYRMRQEEEVEKRIALEEAQYVGAYFGKSRLEVGMLLEDREYENWKIWAGKEAQKREANQVDALDDDLLPEDADPEALEERIPLGALEVQT